MASDSIPDLDRQWDFGDPAGSESRFRAGIEAVKRLGDDALLVEWLSQLARSLGLQRRFDESSAVLDDAEARSAASHGRPRIRCLLERGRLLNSSGCRDASKPLFLEAWETARSCAEDALAVDAAHMLAIVEEPAAQIEWNERALELSRRSLDPVAARWRGSLLNNLGWTYHDLGDPEKALALFEEALEARLENGSRETVRTARWCVARAKRSLGRLDEALGILRSLSVELGESRESDGYVDEEIGECLLAMGRAEEAKPHFRRAHELLSEDPWLAESEPERLTRLSALS